MNKPNILFITTDHQRYDCVRANGNRHIQTPVLDRMASEGISLERCYVQSPVCMPSRASIWTGRYPQNHRVTDNGIALPKTEATMPRAFQQAGYRTANIGKLHFLPHYGRDHTKNDVEYAGYGYDTNLLSDEPGCYPDAYIRWVERVAPQHLAAVRVPLPVPGQDNGRNHFQGWIFGAPEEYSHPAWIASEACKFLSGYDKAQPFFLSLGFYAPHPPLNPSKRFFNLYDPYALPMPTQHPSDMEKSSLRNITSEQWRQDIAYFYAMCSMVDHYVGCVVEVLRQAAMLDDTIIVFMSDHGDALGDHGMVNKGPANYESIIRVPCLIRWPNGGLTAGRRVKGLVEAVDIFPTLCELAAVPTPKGVKGQGMKSLFKGERSQGRTNTLTEFKNPRTGLSVKTLRTEDFKYFRFNGGREILYDLREKDQEVFNRADDSRYASDLATLRELLLSRLVEAEDDLPEKTHPY
jgi:arylsulfatase A-like enzyme